MDTVLVTGGMGCIGAWVLSHLVQQGVSAVSFDQSQDRSRLNLLLTSEQQESVKAYAVERARATFGDGPVQLPREAWIARGRA